VPGACRARSDWCRELTRARGQVQAGYRVARVEQTETPLGREERMGKKTGMVRRELCQIHSPGAMTLSVRQQ
jgi:DNA mismatch repair ATPase MutS